MIVRYLGPQDFGRYAFVLGVGSWLVALAQSSGTTALLVLAAQDRQDARSLIWPGLKIQASIGLIAILISLPSVWILSQDVGLLLPIVIYGLGNLAYIIVSVPVSIFRGLDRMEWGLAFSASGVMTVILVTAVVIFDLGFESTFIPYAFSQFIILAVIFPTALRRLPEERRTRSSALRSQLWRMSVALWGMTLFQSLHWRIGLLALQAISGSHVVGIFSAAGKLVENLRVIPWFLLLAVLPSFAQRAKLNRELIQPLMERALRYVLFLAFPLVAVLTLFGPKIIDLLYTAEYAMSIRVFMIALIGLIPLFAHWVFLNSMISLRMERQLIFAYIIGIFIELIFDILFIPLWGASGAAAGYVIGEVVVAILSGLFLIRTLGGFKYGPIVRTAIPGFSALALAWMYPPQFGEWIWALMICIGYVLGILIFRAISVNELLNLVKRRPISITTNG